MKVIYGDVIMVVMKISLVRNNMRNRKRDWMDGTTDSHQPYLILK